MSIEFLSFAILWSWFLLIYMHSKSFSFGIFVSTYWNVSNIAIFPNLVEDIDNCLLTVEKNTLADFSYRRILNPIPCIVISSMLHSIFHETEELSFIPWVLFYFTPTFLSSFIGRAGVGNFPLRHSGDALFKNSLLPKKKIYKRKFILLYFLYLFCIYSFLNLNFNI